MHETVKTLVPLAFTYKNRAGKFLQRFLDGLKDKKIIASKCSGCGTVYLPPRSACGKCYGQIEEFVEVKDEGEIVNFTVAYVKIDQGKIKKLEEKEVLGLVKLEGVDSLFLVKILNKPEEVSIGAKVKAAWDEERQGTYSDLKGFVVS